MLLEIEQLRVETTVGAKRTTIVDGVSLSLERGEVLGLIGESGAGKSTIGLAALGYIRSGCCATGRVLFEGMDLLSAPARTRRALRGHRVAYVAQSAAAAFNPAHDLNSQLIEVPVRKGLMSPKEARREAANLFRRLLLPDPDEFGRRYPHQVSGGQLQRAMAAMAMICRPDLVVLDEPTTALDVSTQIEFLALVRDLIRQEGVSALYITHDLALVAQLSTRIMVLRHGVIEEQGPAERLLTNPQSAYAKSLIGAVEPQGRSRVTEAVGQPLLQIQGLSARYRTGPVVLDGVTLDIALGQTVAVVGESGSGKSSLARAVVGLLTPVAGRILYKGSGLGGLRDRSQELRRAIQLIHQSPDLALNPQERVEHAIGRPLQVFHDLDRRRRRERVLELLETVGLSEKLATRLPHELSGGEKQRVCIARALAARPELLICDEVTASLDVLVARDILDLLRRLTQDMGMACILITHDFGVVKAMADRVVVMLRGRVVDQGTQAEVMDSPTQDYTARLLAAVPEMRVGWMDDFAARQSRPFA